MAKVYPTNGAAAYDIYANRESTARPLLQPQRLPDAPVYHPPVQKTKTRLQIPLFAIVAAAVVAVLLFSVVYSYARLYEEQMAVAELEAACTQLAQEEQSLKAQYENALDLGKVEERARALGMSEPGASQLVYVQVEGRGGETLQGNCTSFGQVFSPFLQKLEWALEYFP